MPIGKICNKCGQYRDYDDFQRDSRVADGHRHICKECQIPGGPKSSKRRKDFDKGVKPVSHITSAVRNHTTTAVVAPRYKERMVDYEDAKQAILAVRHKEDLATLQQLIKLRVQELTIKQQIADLKRSGASKP